MSEPADVMRKRLHMRSIRRGIKEMDLILTRFSERRLVGLSEDELVRYDSLLAENDQDLYQWVSGQTTSPAEHAEMIAMIRQEAVGVTRP